MKMLKNPMPQTVEERPYLGRISPRGDAVPVCDIGAVQVDPS